MVVPVSQFDVCINRGANREGVPFLLSLQHAAANVLETRLAVPLIPAKRRRGLIDKVEPLLSVDGEPYVAVVSQIRAIPLTDFGEVRASAKAQDQALTNALDFLVTGY